MQNDPKWLDLYEAKARLEEAAYNGEDTTQYI